MYLFNLYTGNKIYIDDELYYTVFRIKNRVILSPCDELKKQQRYFLNAIKWEYSYKSDVLKTAGIHTGNRWVLKMDIKDFYGSVPYTQIRKFVKKVCTHIKNANFTYYYSLVTLNEKLPTGAPTSGHIANFCFLPLGKEIANICHNRGVNYSRYMDDLTFSCDSKKLLQDIEKTVTKLLLLKGYKVNEKKTKYICQNKQQNILGLVVNGDKARLPKTFKRKIRAMVHSYIISKSNITDKQLKHHVWGYSEENRLNGYLAYIKHSDYEFYLKITEYKNKLAVKYNAKTS